MPMNDQAQKLRSLFRSSETQIERDRKTRIITITSGKGGVGKSNFTLNFARVLQSLGYKCLIFDADIGLANIDVLMGKSSRYSLYHLLKKEKTIWEIIQKVNEDLHFIAGGSGFNDLLHLTDEDLNHFMAQIEQLNGYVDFIFFDTGAGLSKETLKFIVAAEETIIITTPEPTAITDAYAIIKMIHTMGHQIQFKLVVNKVSNLQEGQFTAEKITKVAQQFLGLNMITLGYVPEDSHVPLAVKRQVPFTELYPQCAASKGMRQLANTFLTENHPEEEGSLENRGLKGFLQRMVKMLR